MDARIQECLELIEESQRLMLRASQALCSVDGFANEWSDTCLMYGKIKQHWHKVEARRIDLRNREARRAAAEYNRRMAAQHDAELRAAPK